MATRTAKPTTTEDLAPDLKGADPEPAEADTGKTVSLKSPQGTKVTAPAHMADVLKRQGYK